MKLTWNSIDQQIISELKEVTEHSFDYLFESKENESKTEFEIDFWYSSIEDILDISKRYQNVIFVLSDDKETYKIFFQNGKKYTCWPEIVWPEFDSKFLK